MGFIRKLKTAIKNNCYHILAFAIPVAIMLIVYCIREVYPFGDQIYLRSDCYHQYAPFHMELLDKLQTGESLLYSWDIGMGVNFISTIAYYLASPFNFILLFVPASMMTELVGVFIIGKIGLCGLTASYYLGKRFKTVSPATTAFAIFYALSAYVSAYNWNIMWLDCLWLLPLIVYGLERLVEKKKGGLYCVTLGIAIISNYYIGIMLCIYCVLYFLVLLLKNEGSFTLKKYTGDFVRFGFYSLLSGGMAAFLILPEYFTLLLTASSETSFPEDLSRYFSVFDMLSRSLMNVETSVFSAHEPNLYSTVGIFLFVPLYAICKKIPKKERILKLALAVLFLLSFNLNIPNYIWHGLHFPNSLPARESFIYIFLLLTMCFEAFQHIKEFDAKQITACLFGAMALMLIIEQLFVSESFNFMIVYLSAAFILIYYVLCMLVRNPRYITSSLMKLLLIVAVCEAMINTEETALPSTTTREYYLSDNDNISELMEFATEDSDTLFFRTEKENRRSKNDAAWNDYHGVSIFSSTANCGITDLLAKLGMEESYNAYSFYGNTPLTSTILSVKYILSNEVLEETNLQKMAASDGDYYLYENLYTLPLGFMVPKDLLGNWMEAHTNPLVIQNEFCGIATGHYNLFDPLTVESFGTYVDIYAGDEPTAAYFYVNSGCDSVNVIIYDETGTYVTAERYDGLDDNMIVNTTTIPAGGYAHVTSMDDDHNTVSLTAFCLNEDVYLAMYEDLCNEGLVVQEFADTYIKGEVTALSDGYLYTSIPYEEGWTVTVDGVEVETEAFQGAFLTFPVNAGTHTIEFKFFPQGFAAGIAISVTSVLLLILSLVGGVLMKKRKEKLAHKELIEEVTALVEEE